MADRATTDRNSSARHARVAASEVQGSEFGDVALELTRRELPGLDPMAFHLGMLLLRTANTHSQHSERLIHRPHGFSSSGFRILYTVWIFGQAEARDIARLSGMSRQVASSVLATLEADGLVIRERLSTTDRRLVSVRLSEAGAAAIKDAFAQQNRLEREWFGDLTADEQATLKGLLSRVAGRIARTATSAED
ncbi:MarR family winged helix-turn-helix transcriptional regulator [Streptomyces sp. GC420]|uniref:MarR family winged helix-turn-helix transcriptional regulator n=1 Tax=Streptomyces sp. GC420 TaxID=2697568 RepID=UPI0014152785|nr:MarR family transcriptional regulator [Streptomyces sp. GC420]NBM15459.1 MarR family transcriptional regulator [Streptomyces sp. GC420]